MKTVMELFTKYKYLIIVFLFGFISVVSLFKPGLPPTHDGEYHVLRFQQFYKVLSEGSIYPRWAPDFNNGFGIPLFNFVYPLPNYLASFFHLLGFSFIDAFKLNMVVASLVGAVFFYLWARKYWGDVGGVVSSVFYTFSPYHFLDIYVRGSVGEVWSLGLFPGLLWAFHSFVTAGGRRFYILSSVLLSLLIYSHNILALVFFSFFILYSALLISDLKNKANQIKKFVLVTTTGIGLSAPFWLPALYETRYVVGLKTSLPQDHFPVIYKLIYSSWGYGFSGVDGAGQMSFQIGIANILVVCLALILFFFVKEKKILGFFIFSFFTFVFLLTPFSRILWETVPLASFVQFPWRLLSIVILICSFLAGCLVAENLYKSSRKKIIVAVFLISLSVGLSFRYAKAPFHHLRTDEYYLSKSNFTDGTNSPGNAFNTIWLQSMPEKSKAKFILEKGDSLEVIENKTTKYRLVADPKESAKLSVNTAYFPGWTAEINGRIQGIINDRGKISLEIPKGKSTIQISMKNTQVQNLSIVIFFASLVMMVIVYKSVAIIKR